MRYSQTEAFKKLACSRRRICACDQDLGWLCRHCLHRFHVSVQRRLLLLADAWQCFAAQLEAILLEDPVIFAQHVQLSDGGTEDGDEPFVQRSLHEDDGVTQLQKGRGMKLTRRGLQ